MPVLMHFVIMLTASCVDCPNEQQCLPRPTAISGEWKPCKKGSEDPWLKKLDQVMTARFYISI